MKNKNFQNAFSLMEMMVVLLIVAIIAAATAPMVTKKMARNVGSGDSPWVFTGLNNNIAYNMSGADASAIIGATNYSSTGNQPKYPRLVLAANGPDHPALVFAGADGAYGGQINMDPDHSIVTMNDQTVGKNSVAFGYGQSIGERNVGVVAIGSGVTCGSEAVAIGHGANANGEQIVAIGSGVTCGYEAVAVGHGANAKGDQTVAIGTRASATDLGSIAIGVDANSTGCQSIAIGDGATSTGYCSIAIGHGTNVTANNQIVLGTANDTVYIPGNLKVGRNTLLGAEGRGYRTWISHKTRGRGNWNVKSIEVNKGSNDDYRWGEDYSESAFKSAYSDRRLKNVGEKYTAGLDELKKLDFYHYTFKADKDNTPLVGVMAQDLQKVFPDAVTKGEDGYLRIRLEDMFYAVINAVKELDTKISEIVTTFDSKLDSQNQRIESLEKQNSELQKQNEELQEEIKDIEKRIKKLEK